MISFRFNSRNGVKCCLYKTRFPILGGEENNVLVASREIYAALACLFVASL